MTRAARAHVLAYPKKFRARQVATNGTKLYVRVGGGGPAVVLLHGYGETGDMWVPLANDLARDHTVVVPDLRGMGLSAKPAGGYDKKTQAGDVAGILDALKVERAALVTHDIGNMVGYAFAAQYRSSVTRFVVIDAPLAGRGPVGGDPQEPAAMALPLWRPGHGAAGGRSRAHLPRPVLERVLRHPKAVSRDGPPALREALCPPWRNACGVRAVRGLRPGRCRQQGLRRGGQARCAGSSAGRGKIIRHDDGRSDALCGERCGRRDSSALRALDHRREPQGDHRAGSRFPRQGPIIPQDRGPAALSSDDSLARERASNG